ncbi:spermatogenesis-associated protein 1-like isoform X4 [Varroa jacobsoni]|uniref:spermatogenesis-associated protein 1-like isoform X4 n=1 Tax=Varroa jacobsoni TaxID=62625 RepID=UPI000BF2F328|nr:spermatogenesis-associated protein 1-like isoform X4 [Varroa jacobsoni]
MKPRPISAQLVDLHVYVIPEEDWISHRKLATNAAVVSDAVSAGFIRVLPAMRLDEVREEIHDQLGLDNVPITFIFLRSVGRNFTQVKPHQEGELKVKYFCPPFAAEPELYLKSGDYQEGDSLAQLDFDAAVATSTPLAINSGNNSAADESQESPSPPGSGEEPKVVKGGNRGGGGDSSEQNSLAGKEKETSSSQNRLLPKRNSTAHGSDNDDNQKDNVEKLRAKLDNLRAERRECEAQKEEMVRHVKGLQGKLIQEKETVHDMWKKRYYEEKKITPKLEEESAKLRQELERIHRDLITRVEGRDANDARSSYTRLEEPSNKLSYKIMISGLLQEIEDLKRRLESTKLRLSAEAKLRAMAEKDVRTLREDLIQKKIQVTLTRKETDSVIAPFYRDTIYSLHPMI